MIKRSFWISGSLFLVLLILTWNLIQKRDAPEEDAFFNLKRRTPDTLIVAYGTDTTVLVPGGAGWLVIRPVQYPSDSFAVEAMLKQLRPLEVDKVYPLPDQKLDSYGLRHPRAFIRASYRDLPPDSLIVGGSTLNGAFDYVRPGGRRIAGLLTSRTSRSYLLKSLEDLRDSRLLPVNENRVVRITLFQNEERRMELLKGEQGRWRVVRPFPGWADPGKTREYLSSLAHMTVQEFIREEGAGDAAFGLDAPRAGVVLETQAGEKLGFSIGDPVPGRSMFYAAAQNRPNVFGVSDRYPPVLEWPADALRQAAPVSFGLAQVSSVTVRTQLGTRDFRLSPPDSTLEPQTVDVLGSWILLRAKGFSPASLSSLQRYGLDVPEGELVWMQGADTLAVVDVGAPVEGTIPMRVVRGREARPEEILLVPRERARPLWVHLTRSLP